MYNVNRRQYIMKMSSGQYVNIYYKSYSGICCSRQNAGGAWTSPSVILKDALPGFSACLDRTDNIHILCQDGKSNIIYISINNDSCQVQPVSRNKKDVFYDKYPYICCLGDCLNFFYIIENMDNRLLFHQTYSSGSLSVPKVIDYIGKSNRSYSVQNYGSKSLSIMYIKPGDKYNRLICRILDEDALFWSDPMEINNCGDLSDKQILASISASPVDYHMCLQKTTPQKYELEYLKININKELCMTNSTLASSPYQFNNASIIALGQRIIAYWVRENSIMYCMSTDNGSTWSKPEKYVLFENLLYSCARFFSNMPGDSRDISSTDIPAVLGEGFRPAFINDYKDEREDSINMEDFRSSILNSLKIVSVSISEINKALRETEDSLKTLEAKFRRMEDDSQEHSSAITLLRGDMAKAVSEMEEIKNSMQNIGAIKYGLEELKEAVHTARNLKQELNELRADIQAGSISNTELVGIRADIDNIKSLKTKIKLLEDNSDMQHSALMLLNGELTKTNNELGDLATAINNIKSLQTVDLKKASAVTDNEIKIISGQNNGIVFKQTSERIERIERSERTERNECGQMPVIIGTGFAHITYDYLRNLDKK